MYWDLQITVYPLWPGSPKPDRLVDFPDSFCTSYLWCSLFPFYIYAEFGPYCTRSFLSRTTSSCVPISATQKIRRILTAWNCWFLRDSHVHYVLRFLEVYNLSCCVDLNICGSVHLSFLEYLQFSILFVGQYLHPCCAQRERTVIQ